MGQHLDKRRFAGAAGADDKYKFALADVQRHMAQGYGTIFIYF